MAQAIAPQETICSIVKTDEPLDLTVLKNKINNRATSNHFESF